MKVVSIHHVRLAFQRTLATHQLPPAVRILSLNRFLPERVTHTVKDLLHLHVERLITVNAEVLVRRRFLVTPRTRHRRRRLNSRWLAHVDAMHRRVGLLLGLPTELRDVPRDDRRPTRASLPVLDERLGLPLRCQPVRVRLPEIRGRHRLLNPSAPRGFPKALQESLITNLLGRRQLRPQEVVTAARMLGQPLRDVRNRRNKVDVVLSTLPIDANLDRMLTISHVADAEVEQLAATEPAFELERNQRSISGISGSINHRFNVPLEVEHVGLIGLGLIVPAGLGRDPVVRVRNRVATRDVLRKHAERDTVVTVRFLGAVLDVVGVVNPAHDGLCGVLGVFEPVSAFVDITPEDRVMEADVGVFAHSRVVPEKFLVTVMPVVLPPETELVGELQQEFPVGLAATTLFVLEFVSKCLDGLLRVTHTTVEIDSAGKPLVESPLPASTKSFTVPQSSSSAATAEVGA